MRSRRRSEIVLVVVGALAIANLPLNAQSRGLRLIQPLGAEPTCLVDEQGSIVHSWANTSSVAVHLLPDGSLIRGVQTGTIPIGGATGRLERLAFDGTVLWDMPVDGPSYMHHDIEPMPNGNVLVIAWDDMTTAGAIAAGRDPALLDPSATDWLPDSILEIQQTGPTTGAVVWEWHMMDHVIQDHDPTRPNFGNVAAHPERVDLNYPPLILGNGDWNHANGLDYDPVNDWIVLCSREQGEFYIIDHSTTTAEAAGRTGGVRGRGGDILYRWGNPHAYRAGSITERTLWGAHDTRFVPPGYPGAGSVTIFNNFQTLGAMQSTVLEVPLPPLTPAGRFKINPQTGQFDPLVPAWSYTDPTFFSAFISSAERLPNGNTLVCSGQQFELFEVDPAGSRVWSYVYPPMSSGSFGVFQAHLVQRAMWADSAELRISGGQVTFDHLTGTTSAGDGVVLLGSAAGTSPGTPLPGGVTVPLQLDYIFSAMATSANTGILVDTFTMLDPSGAASSSIVIPPGFIPPELAGVSLDFAHVVINASTLATRASQPIRLTIVP